MTLSPLTDRLWAAPLSEHDATWATDTTSCQGCGGTATWNWYAIYSERLAEDVKIGFWVGPCGWRG